MLAKGLQDMGVDIISCHNRIVGLLKAYETDKKQEANFKSRSSFSINHMIAEIGGTKIHTFRCFSRILM